MENLEWFFREQCLVGNFDDYFITIINNPREIFSKDSSFKIIELLHIVAADSFGVEPEQKSLDGIKDHVINVDCVSLLHDYHSIFGFASARLDFKSNIFFLHGMAVLRQFQTKGIGSVLIKCLLENSGLSKMTFTTQNPAMFCLLRRFFNDTYPSPVRKIVPEKFRLLGNILMKNRRGYFSSETFVAKGLYSCCLYPKIPDSRDQIVNNWFRQSLKIKDGLTCDGFLFIGESKK